jgi:hypothetical protein
MQISVKVDASGVLAMLQGHERQIPFTVAKALTATAKDAQAAVTQSIPVKFDRPNPFTQKAVTITPATKSNPTAVVFIKDQQAKYLEIQEEGGQRKPEPGSPINLPVKYRVNQYGNLPKGAIAREKTRKDTFIAKRGDPDTRHLAPGIYRRPGGRGNKKSSSPQLLISFKKRARYTPRFGMRDTVEQTVKTAFQQRLAEAVETALRTAR